MHDGSRSPNSKKTVGTLGQCIKGKAGKSEGLKGENPEGRKPEEAEA